MKMEKKETEFSKGRKLIENAKELRNLTGKIKLKLLKNCFIFLSEFKINHFCVLKKLNFVRNEVYRLIF